MSNTSNINNLPIVDQYGRFYGYSQVLIKPNLRETTIGQSHPDAYSSVVYRTERKIDRPPQSGILIGIMIIIIAILIGVIIWGLYLFFTHDDNQ